MRNACTLRFVASLCLGLVVACSSAGSDPPAAAPPVVDPGDAGPATPPAPAPDAAPPAAPYPAFPFSAPQIVSRGGKVLTAPKVALLMYAGDPMTADAQAFVAAVGKSAYWSATTKEYGVGALTALPPITVSDTAPATIDDTAIQAWLAGELDGTHPEVPAPDGQTIYVIAYPEGTTVTRQSETSCLQNGGYHSEATIGATSTSVPYVVLPRCAKYVGLTGKDEFTYALSHELVEAALDPFLKSAPAYADVDVEHRALELALGAGEAGDICPGDSALASDMPFVVQRTWSNASAKAGHHPCVPADPRPYFVSVPVLPETVPTSNIPFVTIAVGASRTIDVQLSSDAPVATDWSVTAIDVASVVYKRPAELSFALDRSTGNNGDVLHLTITAQRQGAINGTKGVSLFILRSTSKDGEVAYVAGVVGN
ncbi:MAG: hypothetical protein JWO86_1050 [Myxococcaceae bacterium]|nr:hypothetical protein [Myxococcaceae bacterium]